MRITSAGRTLATGTARGRALVLTVRRGRTLSGLVTVRSLRGAGRLTPTPVQIR